MRILRFDAKGVHNYIDFHLVFNPQLNFLVGLNGSGKTTALALLMGILTPSLATLREIAFSEVEVVFDVKDKQETTIKASRDDEKLTISISRVQVPFTCTNSELQMCLSLDQDDFDAYIGKNPTLSAIRDLPTPLYLGLDRRFANSNDNRVRVIGAVDDERARRFIHRKRQVTASLDDVQELVRDAILKVRDQQASLDEDFRRRIILDAFDFTPVATKGFPLPDKKVLTQFRAKRAQLEKATRSLGVPFGDVETRLNAFFDRMDAVIKLLEEKLPKKKKDKKPNSAMSKAERTQVQPIVEWIFNRSQVDRISTLFAIIEQHVAAREAANRPTDHFLELVNGFLHQTGKKLQISTDNYLTMTILGTADQRGLTSLSSGERQIVVMIAHLALNSRVANTGVFIVDEPELSLHIAWQEMFVDAIQKASPETQILLATHSPAIILGRDSYCVQVPKGAVDATVA